VKPAKYLSHVLLVAALLTAAFLFGGCASSGTKAESSSESSTSASDSTQSEQSSDQQSQPGEEALYTASYKPNGNEVAVIKTPKGEIKFKFYPKDAPNTAAAFIELAQKGFYDGTKFHRVEPGFVIQGGDPLSKADDPMVGTGGPGYRLKAEFDPATNSQKHLDGAVAMARSQDPDSAGSQFYITLGAQPMLDGQYTVFGQVISGMDVVRSIQVGDVMESVTVENAN
jgi:peptidyl-prolyl cis-trans isomerase B (cyclophilin B)